MVRWRSGRRSSNVEDRRGRGAGPGLKVGGGLGLLVALLVVALLGGDPAALLEVLGGDDAPPASTEGGPPPPGDAGAQFASAILASTEDAWSRIFAERGASYRPATLVLFDDLVRSRCGIQGSATGPFYCPLDGNVYLDLGFFRQLEGLGASGDFARAYVIGHEVGHHVQNLAGTLEAGPPGGAAAGASTNERSVMIELQADCYAGLWAHHADRSGDFLEPGDVEEGLDAAAAIGDDRLQRRGGGVVQPESFTHGSSAQRARWLRTGLETGSLEACDTFAAGPATR